MKGPSTTLDEGDAKPPPRSVASTGIALGLGRLATLILLELGTVVRAVTETCTDHGRSGRPHRSHREQE